MVLEIIKGDNPLLKTKSEKVKTINDEIRELANDMSETMLIHNGIGLAAIQVGKPLRMIVVLNNDLNKLIDAREYPTLIMINPKITKKSEKLVKMTEGCLSYGELRKRIERPEEIEVEYYNLEGKKVNVKINGINARVVEHEYDHLEGITIDQY